MSPVTGLVLLAGRILPSVHIGNFSLVTVHMENFSSVSEMKARSLKFHPGNPGWSVHMNTSKFLQRNER